MRRTAKENVIQLLRNDPAVVKATATASSALASVVLAQAGVEDFPAGCIMELKTAKLHRQDLTYSKER
jgi:hypothetical protein